MPWLRLVLASGVWFECMICNHEVAGSIPAAASCQGDWSGAAVIVICFLALPYGIIWSGPAQLAHWRLVSTRSYTQLTLSLHSVATDPGTLWAGLQWQTCPQIWKIRNILTLWPKSLRRGDKAASKRAWVGTPPLSFNTYHYLWWWRMGRARIELATSGLWDLRSPTAPTPLVRSDKDMSRFDYTCYSYR